MNALKKILSLSVYSGYIKHEKPLSILIVSKPESGKTEMLLKFSRNKKILTLTDATAFGIRRDVVPAVRAGEINHILIPDLLKPLNRSRDAVNDFVTILNSLIEEGIGDITTYNEKQISEDRKEMAQCGILTSITPEELMDRRRKWGKLGFLSRAIPISYRYSKESVEKILGFISNQNYKDDKDYITFNDLPNKKQDIELSLEKAKYIIKKAVVPAQAEGLYGFRTARQFIVLLKSNALMNGRTYVNDNDVEEIEKLLYWINFELKEIK